MGDYNGTEMGVQEHQKLVCGSIRFANNHGKKTMWVRGGVKVACVLLSLDLCNPTSSIGSGL